MNHSKRPLSGSAALFGKRLLRAVPLIALVILLTFLLERSGWLRSFEAAALDTFILLREPLEDKNVVIVGITDDDYKEYFGERSPLDPNRLKDIIDSIAKGHPAVIGVDLDTSAEIFRQLQPSPPPPVVVWARNGKRVTGDGAGGQGQRLDRSDAEQGKPLPRLLSLFKFEDERFQVSNVLGRGGSNVTSGVAIVPLDNDSAVRRYRRHFKTTESAMPVADSFSWAVVKEYGKSTGHIVKESAESEEGWALNFAVAPHSFKAINIHELRDRSDTPGWAGGRGPLKDKIVLLGGLYSTSRDQHYTPTGPRYGVELLAYAIESDLQGKTLKPPSKYLLWLGELLVGFGLILVHTRFKHRPRSLRYSIIAVPLLGLLASFLLFSSLALWALFLPVLLAVLIQQLHEDLQDYRKREVHKIFDEAAALGQDLKQVLATFRDEPPIASRRRSDGDAHSGNKPRPREGANETAVKPAHGGRKGQRALRRWRRMKK